MLSQPWICPKKIKGRMWLKLLWTKYNILSIQVSIYIHSMINYV